MKPVNQQKSISPEEYLEQKQVKAFLVRIVNSLLEARPDNIEKHVAGLLASYHKASTPTESFPSYGKPPSQTPAEQPAPKPMPQPQRRPEALAASSAGRRYSMIDPNLLRKGGNIRRNAMSSKLTSNTECVIQEIKKDEETTRKLIETTKKVDLFSFLQPNQRQTLVGAMDKKQYSKGSIIIKQGDQPDNFYIIESGQCRVSKNIQGVEKDLCVLGPDAYFGELALISGSTRAATVTAISDVTVWAIDQSSYRGLLRDQHSQKRQLYSKLLKNVPFLQVLPDYEILLVIDALQPLQVPPGGNVVTQGENGDEFFIILEGECTVWKDGSEVAKLSSGNYFGELALMQNQPRAATVKAGMDAKLVKLDRASFHRLLGPCNQFFADKIKSY